MGGSINSQAVLVWSGMYFFVGSALDMACPAGREIHAADS